MSALLPADEMLWSLDMDTVCILANGITRSKARYSGYHAINDAQGVGVFYPDEFEVRKVWLRVDLRCGPESEYSHMICGRDHPAAEAYWEVSYVDKPKVWRDGRWRSFAYTAPSENSA